jgi:hypothetical protein
MSPDQDSSEILGKLFRDPGKGLPDRAALWTIVAVSPLRLDGACPR